MHGEYNQARKAPWIIHFAGYQKPWDAVDCDFADYFWKYAALSPFYPVLLRSYSRVLCKEEGTGIEEVRSENAKSQKILCNGRILILRDGKSFNVIGIRVE